MSLEAYEELLNQVQQLRDRCAELEHGMDKAKSDHENYREWTSIIENQYFDTVQELQEKLKPIPLKNKFTAGLQFQVAKINELEKQLKDNHERAEAIIKGREDLICHLHNELKERDERIHAIGLERYQDLNRISELEAKAKRYAEIAWIRTESFEAIQAIKEAQQQTVKEIFDFLLECEPNHPQFGITFAMAVKKKFQLRKMAD